MATLNGIPLNDTVFSAVVSGNDVDDAEGSKHHVTQYGSIHVSVPDS